GRPASNSGLRALAERRTHQANAIRVALSAPLRVRREMRWRALRKDTELQRTVSLSKNLRMGRHIIFRCPQTGLKVQHWLNEVAAAEPGHSYQSVECPSC